MLLKNLLTHFPDASTQESMDELVKDGTVRIERIVSFGQASPPGFWYDQDEHEWVVVLTGQAGICWKDQNATMTLKPGDSLYIPAHTKHRVEWTEKETETVWVAVFWKKEEREKGK